MYYELWHMHKAMKPLPHQDNERVHDPQKFLYSPL